MNIQELDIKLLKPYELNAKKHDKTQIENVAQSISQFGWQQPIVVDKDYVIIIGHCRFEAAKLLKLEKVPVVVASELDEEKVKKLRLIDNKTNESDWDFDLLREDIGELNFDGFEIDWGIPEEQEEQEVEEIYYDEDDIDDVLKEEKHYGVPYQGNKSRIADKILSVLPSGKRLVDLFGGGGAITHCALLKDKWGGFYTMILIR